MFLARLFGVYLGLMLLATAGFAQVPTAPTLDRPETEVEEPTIEPMVLPPQHYTPDMVAQDTLTLTLDMLNEPTHQAAYLAALSEIRETVVKDRMTKLKILYVSQLLLRASRSLGLNGMPLNKDIDLVMQVHEEALRLNGIKLALPELPKGGAAVTMKPVTPGELLHGSPR